MAMDPVTISLILEGMKLVNDGMKYFSVINDPNYDPSKINLEELKVKLDSLPDLPEELKTRTNIDTDN